MAALSTGISTTAIASTVRHTTTTTTTTTTTCIAIPTTIASGIPSTSSG